MITATAQLFLEQPLLSRQWLPQRSDNLAQRLASGSQLDHMPSVADRNPRGEFAMRNGGTLSQSQQFGMHASTEDGKTQFGDIWSDKTNIHSPLFRETQIETSEGTRAILVLGFETATVAITVFLQSR